MAITCYFKKENKIAKLILTKQEADRIKGIGRSYLDVWNGGNCDAVATCYNTKSKMYDLWLFISDNKHARNLIKDKAFLDAHFKSTIRKAVIFQRTAGTRELIDLCVACGVDIEFQLKEKEQ